MTMADTPVDRPDLQRLLDDIRARKIDVIVVYKVDRLTRSLADFARLVELFDAQGVSFVSVTQQFNTTSSRSVGPRVRISFAPAASHERTGPRAARCSSYRPRPDVVETGLCLRDLLAAEGLDC